VTRIRCALEDVVRRVLNLPPRIVGENVLGCPVKVVKGSVRRKPDYDDAWVLACARHAQVVLDAGANVGQDTLLMLLGSGVKKIIVVDANEDALCICAENIIRNGLSSRAVFFRAFLGETDGAEIKFWTVWTGAAGSMYRSHAQSASRLGRCFAVSTLTIDSLCTELDVWPDFAKVDVEGAEVAVLRGARRLVERRNTRFLVEVHSSAELPMERNVEDLLQWCRDFGMKAWYLKEHCALEGTDLVKMRGRFHALVQPDDWSFPEWLRDIGQGDVPLAHHWGTV